MGGWGWDNSWPREYGSGRTLVERHYDFLRRAPGKGGASEDEESIESLWRQEKAQATAALEAFTERPLAEAFPFKAMSFLPYFEDLLTLPVPPGSSDEARRQRASRAYTFENKTDIPSLGDQLQAIDSRLSVLDVPWDQTESTEEGRSFEDLDAVEPYGGGRRSTVRPNYSTAFDVIVLFDLSATGGVPTPADAKIIDEVKDYLSDILGSWVDFRIISSVGFILDQSPLDITGFGT